MMTENKGGFSGSFADMVAKDVATRVLMGKLDASKAENEKLREQLAQSDQQIEWLSKENAALKREAREVSVALLGLRDVTTEALVAMRKRVDHGAAEIEKLRGYVKRDGDEVEKWRERHRVLSTELAVVRDRSGKQLDIITSLELEIDQLERNNEYLRGRVAFLAKALGSKPGTMYFGNEGFFLRGEEER